MMSLTNKHYLILCLLFLYLPVTQAEKVYRSVDGQGVVEFSDQSNQGSEEVNVPDVPTYKAVKVKPVASPTQPRAAGVPVSAQIQIVSPTAKETIRSNPGDMTVVVSLPRMDKGQSKQQQTVAPKNSNKLREGQKIVLSMDGKIIRETDQTTIELKNVDRGTHHLQAALVDAKGKHLAESEVVEFYMMRFSKLFKQPKKTPPPAPAPK